MADDDIPQRVIGAIARTIHRSPESIPPEATFEAIGIDSLDGMQILFALEQEFDISIPDDEAKKIRSVPDVIAGVRQLLAGKG
jgi:acyl carrier protein